MYIFMFFIEILLNTEIPNFNDMHKNPFKFRLPYIFLGILLAFSSLNQVSAQLCTSTSAPTPQLGAMMRLQFTNLWKQAHVSDIHGDEFHSPDHCSIGADGWPIAGKDHGIRFYPEQIQPVLKPGEIIKIRYKGANDAFTSMGMNQWQCTYQNVQINTPRAGYTTLEMVLLPDFLTPGYNGFHFKFKGHIEDVEIIRPGYDFGDPRLLTDEYVAHTRHWTTFRYMEVLHANSNFGQTWAKRVSSNAPAYINEYAWSAPDCPNPSPNFRRFSEDITPDIAGSGTGMWAPGAPWELVIDISNYLNKDMWINIPTMADDNYVLQLSKLIKQRLKPTLNVNVEIGNELWNFGPPFMGYGMVKQVLAEEWNQKDPEKLKILGGSYCPSCELPAPEDNRNRTSCGYDDYPAMQRWMARRLKEMMDQFAVDWGWKAEGGVGSRIRATLAGQVGYGSQGHAWNIGMGIEFLAKAYGPESVSKYLYSTSIAAYFKPQEPSGSFTKNLSLDQISQNYSTHPMRYIFGEFADEKWEGWGIGNQAEGVFGLSRMYGLKMYAYEGGNEIGNGGNGDANGWITYDNASAALADQRFGNVNTDLLNAWFSWFGYDALFMKNGDIVGENNAYGISQTLNENNSMRESYIKVANSPAPPLSKIRGGVIGVPAITVLDARKHSSYYENWDVGRFGIRHKNYRAVVDNNYVGVSDANNEPPMIIRCEKTGTYKIELERELLGTKTLDDKYPTYCDIFLNEKLVKAGVRFNVQAFSRSFNSPNGNTYNYWWTEAVDLDIPYGVHALRIRPSLPTAERRGNQMAIYDEDPSKRFQNELNLMSYRFTLSSELPPVQPKQVIGDLEVCKGNNKARYEVGENDGSVCEYEWMGLPTTAKIQPAELVAGSSPARYTSGPKTYKAYIDWGTTEPNTYDLSVKGRNQKSDGTWQESPVRTFKVVIKNCGFDFNQSPVCLNQEVTFKPIPVPNAKEYQWDNGKFGQSNAIRFSTLSTAATYKTTYDTPGDYTVNLKVTDNSDNVFFYSNRIVAVSCNSPIVVTPVVYCLGETPAQLAATPSGSGTNLKWYTTPTGGTGSTTAPTPDASKVDTVVYYVTQMNNSGNDESERSRIEVRVNPKPSAPVVSTPNPLVYCVGATAATKDLTDKVTYTSGVVTVAKWYTSNTATTSADGPTVPNTSTPSTTTWYVSQSIGACESPRTLLTVNVNAGPQFTVDSENPATCGQKGKLILKDLTPATVYTVSYNTPAITADSTSNAAGEIVLNLAQGTYSNIKVGKDGCTTSAPAPGSFTLTEPAAPVYTVTVVPPAECGAQGALNFTQLNPNTTYKVSYNSVVDAAYATAADGSFNINLPPNNYTGIKVTLGECSTNKSTTYLIPQKDVLPPVATLRAFNYCQGQVISLQDITDRVSADPNYRLNWYTTEDGIPRNQPEAINSAVAITTERWVSQANAAGCESPKLKLTITVASSTVPEVSTEPITACGLSDGKIVIKGLTPLVSYVVDYKKESATQPSKTSLSNPQGEFIIDGLGSGTYSSITVIPESGAGCFTNSAAEVNLVEPNAPTIPPTLSPGREYCASETILPLRATANSGGTIEWYDNASTTGTPTIGTEYTPSTVTGSRTFYALENVAGCKSPVATVSITIVPNPTVQELLASGGPASCNGTGYPLTLRTSEIGVNYQFFRDGVMVSNPQPGTGASVTLATLSEKGSYTVKAVTAVNSCAADVTGTLTISDQVDPTKFTVSGGGEGCEGVATMADILLSGSQINVTYSLQPSSKSLEGTGNTLTYIMEASKSNNGVYTVTATDNLNGCTSEMTGSAEIDIQSGPDDPVIAADSAYCNKEITTIGLTSNNATSQTWSISPQTAGNIGENTGVITWASDYSGPATITVVVSNSLCPSASKTASVETKAVSVPVLEFIQGDSMVCKGEEVMYQALPSSKLKYDWSVAGNVSILEDNQDNGTVKLRFNDEPDKDGFVINVLPISPVCGVGASISKQINKDPSCDLFVPNILTLKDKGSANGWHIEGVENYPKMTIQIFNRWGAEVHKHTGKYEKPWDGSNASGAPLPTATYYYVLDKQDGSAAITGSVTVVRD